MARSKALLKKRKMPVVKSQEKDLNTGKGPQKVFSLQVNLFPTTLLQYGLEGLDSSLARSTGQIPNIVWD